MREKFNVWIFIQPLPKREILGSPKLKELADDNFKFDENSEDFSKRVENAVGNGEMSNFFFSPQCFQESCTADM